VTEKIHIRRGNMKVMTEKVTHSVLAATLAACLLAVLISGCGGSAMKAHQDTIGNMMKGEYYVPAKPVDQAYIGCPWSRQFGALKDQCVPDIATRKERSFDAMQQDFAYNLGFALGGQTLVGAKAKVGIDGGTSKQASLEGVEIIMADSLADIPFEPKVPYVTEALRLANFALRKDSGAGVQLDADTGITGATGTALAEGSGGSTTRTEGTGLVVAYKLHTINMKSYQKEDSGTVALELDRIMDFPKMKVVVKAYLQNVEPGSNKSLPRNLVWSCPRANSMSKDMVAAWIVEIKPLEPGKRPLAIAFPALPKVDECYFYSGVMYSRIDPLTDKIHRQKIVISVLEAEVSDSLKPSAWVTRMSLVDESFNIRLVEQSDL
jgi:hypothetical protein